MSCQQVRCLTDHGEFETQDGNIILFKKNTQVCLIIVANIYRRVCTDPGKVWKVLQFNVKNFNALKSLQNDHRYGRVWEIP